METESQTLKAPSVPEALRTVTPVSKYFAMLLFITMPFIGGWIGYTYAPEKIVEIETVKTVKSENSFSPLYQTDSLSFILPFSVIEKPSEFGGSWINIVLSAESETPLYSFITNEKINGDHCYLGLCTASTSTQFKSEGDLVWSEVDTTNCVGGCEAISKLFRATRNESNHYFIIWKGSDETYGMSLLRSFTLR